MHLQEAESILLTVRERERERERENEREIKANFHFKCLDPRKKTVESSFVTKWIEHKKQILICVFLEKYE